MILVNNLKYPSSKDKSNSFNHLLIYSLSYLGFFKTTDLISSMSLGLPAITLWIIKSSKEANLTIVSDNFISLALCIAFCSYAENALMEL